MDDFVDEPRQGASRANPSRDAKRAKTSQAPKKQEKLNSKQEERREKKKFKIRNKEFARVTYVFVCLFLAMMGYICYFNIVRSKNIINSPYNTRQDSFADRIVRGKILDKDGNVLAQTNVNEDGSETREYPYHNMYAHIVGYSSKGKGGLESLENYNLLTSNAFILERMFNEIKGQKNSGDDVVTTLDTKLQQAAYDALGNDKGAVVVMEPSTGKILVSVSKPDYDPNSVKEDWENLNTSEESVMLNRAMQGLYAPGSTFKIVTTLEYMRENPDYLNYSFNCEGHFTYEGTTIHCFGEQVHGQEDLGASLANSCNTSYSNIGLKLDLDKYKKTAEELLFNSKLPSVLATSQSRFKLSKKDPSSEVMMTAIGQGKLQVSPYHMALITSAIANGGTLMKPYLVSAVQNHTGTQISKTMPEAYGELMKPEEARQLAEYMKQVVDYGTASSLGRGSYSVAGKTGTAEYSTDKERTHSWFIGYSNIEQPDIVVSVIVEDSSSTGTVATNVAKHIFDKFYE